ncbi:methanogenesis marker 2 protein, partial [Methanosalsum natronophilum]
NSVPLAQWLKVYPATGYIVTATEDNVEPCITTFEETGLTAAAIGTIDNTGKIELLFEDESDTAFDFRYDSITGINMKS